MKSVICYIKYFIFFGLSLFAITACESTTKGTKKEAYTRNYKVNYIRPPQWVIDPNNDWFSAVGITNQITDLPQKKELAESNAIENLRLNILVKLETFLFEKFEQFTPSVELSKQKMIIYTFKKDAHNALDLPFLSMISRQDEMWQSVNSNSLYIQIVSDRKQIAMRLLPVIERLQRQYSYDSDILFFLISVKKDMLYNNFECSKNKNDMPSQNITTKKAEDININNKEDNKNIKNQVKDVGKKQPIQNNDTNNDLIYNDSIKTQYTHDEAINNSIKEAIRIAEQQYEESENNNNEDEENE